MTVSDEAVEAAAGVYFENRGDCTYRDAFRLALEAAAPFIAAQAWDEGMRAGKSRAMRHMSDEPGLSLSIPNPYKSEH